MNNYGQYFTKSILLQEKIYSLILNNPDVILEPCVGRGDLVRYMKRRNRRFNFDLYEIDDKLEYVIKKENIIFCDFLKLQTEKKYATIIGNPPYIKTKKGNLYLDFIRKCYELLETKGELIFIVPSDFFKLTSATNLLNTMFLNGSFTHVFHPNNETLFENATIDIIVFRYCKDTTLEKKTLYNDKLMYTNNNTGLITFSENEVNETRLFRDYFEIYVGLVSGNDRIFQNDILGNVSILLDKNITKKYIMINQFPTPDENINIYLLNNKKRLLERKICIFHEKNWFKWCMRNIKQMKKYKDTPCIYISTITRHPEVAFKSSVTYFGSKLLVLIPKNNNVNLDKTVVYLNSQEFKQNFTYSGRFKIGNLQLSKHVISSHIIDK